MPLSEWSAAYAPVRNWGGAEGEEVNESAIAYILLDIWLQCYSGEELLTIYNVSHEAGVTQAQFQELSAALIQQVLQGCAHEEEEHDDDDDDEPSTAES